MYARNRVAWLILAWMLVAGACGAPGLDPRSAAATLGAQTGTISPADTAQPDASDSRTRLEGETPTPNLGNTPAEAEAVPSVDRAPAVATKSSETSTPVTESEAGEATPEGAGAGSGPTQEQLKLLADLKNFGPASELHNETWLNSEPLTLADLRGKVVMVEFWTFG